jgi:hypothetical protein
MSAKRPSLAESMRQVAQTEPVSAPTLAAPAPAPLPRAVAVKADPAPVPAKATVPPPVAKPSGFYAATRAGKKKVTVALDPPAHKRLKGLAVEREATTEALLQEAIADLFAKYGRAATP